MHNHKGVSVEMVSVRRWEGDGDGGRLFTLSRDVLTDKHKGRLEGGRAVSQDKSDSDETHTAHFILT